MSIPEEYSEPCETSEIGRFAEIVSVLNPLNIFTKRSILDVWQCSEYASASSSWIESNNFYLQQEWLGRKNNKYIQFF